MDFNGLIFYLFETLTLVLTSFIVGLVLGWLFFGRKGEVNIEGNNEANAALENQLKRAQADLKACNRKLQDAEGKVSSYQQAPDQEEVGEIDEVRARLEDAEAELAEYRTKLSSLEQSHESTGAGGDGSNASPSEWEIKYKQAEARLKSAGLTIDPSAEKDDLKKIYGIGPWIEGRLAELGITTYKQVANLTSSEIEKISDFINYFPGRIERDGWKKHARDLHQTKYGEDIS